MIGQKIIRSVQDPAGNIIQKQPEGGTGRTRCMKCQCIVTAQRQGSGQMVMKCSGCGAAYTSSPLDRPRAARPGEVPKRVPK